MARVGDGHRQHSGAGRRGAGVAARRKVLTWPAARAPHRSSGHGDLDPRADQALRRRPAVDGLDLDVREGDVYGFLGAERLGQDDDGPDAARAGARHLGRRSSFSVEPMPRGCASGCCRRSARWSRAPRRTRTSPGGPTCPCSTRWGRHGDRADADRRGSTRRSSGRPRRRRPPSGQGVLARDAAAARPGRRAAAPPAAAGARRADQRPRPAGHPRDPRACCSSSTPAAPRSSCPATCSPRSSRCARRVGVVDRGRLVLQERLDALQRPTGRVRVRTPDADPGGGAARRTGRGARRRPPARSAPPTRPSSTAASSPPGSASPSSRPSGAPSRTSCSRRPAAGARTGWRGTDDRASSCASCVRSRRTWVTIAAARRAADPRRGAAGGHRPRPAPRHRPGVPVGRAHRRHAVPPRRDRHRAAAVPARSAVAVVAGDSIAGEAQAGTLRYLLIRPVGRTRLLVAKLVSVDGASSCSRCVVVAATAYVLGRAAPRRREPTAAATTRVRARSLTTRSCSGAPAWSLAYAMLVDARRRRDRAVPLDAHRARRWRPRMGTLAVLIASTLLLDARRGAVAAARTCRRATGCRSSTCSATRSSGATSNAAPRSRPSTSWCSSAPAWANFMTKDITDLTAVSSRPASACSAAGRRRAGRRTERCTTGRVGRQARRG